MFIINGIDFSKVAHGCQKRGRHLLVEYEQCCTDAGDVSPNQIQM